MHDVVYQGEKLPITVFYYDMYVGNIWDYGALGVEVDIRRPKRFSERVRTVELAKQGVEAFLERNG